MYKKRCKRNALKSLVNAMHYKILVTLIPIYADIICFTQSLYIYMYEYMYRWHKDIVFLLNQTYYNNLSRIFLYKYKQSDQFCRKIIYASPLKNWFCNWLKNNFVHDSVKLKISLGKINKLVMEDHQIVKLIRLRSFWLIRLIVLSLFFV